MPIREVYEAPILEDNEETCIECHGTGRVIWCHRMVGGHDYRPCDTCDGSGKTIKRPKCKVLGCDNKCAINTIFDVYDMKKLKKLNELGLCDNCRDEHNKLKTAVKRMQESIVTRKQELENLEGNLLTEMEKLAEFEKEIINEKA